MLAIASSRYNLVTRLETFIVIVDVAYTHLLLLLFDTRLTILPLNSITYDSYEM